MTEYLTKFGTQAYSLVTGEEKQKEWHEELEESICAFCPALTFQQRVIGCVICLIIGLCISIGSTVRIVELLKGDPVPFAVMYTTGNIIGMSASCFLYGPWAQAKKMFAQTRLVATGFFFFFMGLTLFLAFYPGDLTGRLFFLVFSIMLQFLALVWYTISFIPFARDMVLTCCKSTCGCGECECCASAPPPQERSNSMFGL